MDYGSAVMRSATVPFGWIIGCPLLGLLSDRIGRRKPVISGSGDRAVRLSCVDSLWPARSFSSLRVGSVDRHRVRRSDVALHRNQRSQPAAVWWHGDRRCQLPKFHFQRVTGPGIRSDPAKRFRRSSTQMELQHYQSTFIAACCIGVAIAIVLTAVVERNWPGIAHRSPEPKER